MIHIGDCRDILKTLPDDYFDSIVTDPPYGLSFMGKRWDYDVPSVEIWAECLRVLRPGGHVLDPFAGSGSTGRGAIAEGMRFTGIELDPSYAAIAEARIRAMQPGLALGDAA